VRDSIILKLTMESHPKSGGTQINLENFGLKVTNAAVEVSLKESIGKIFTNTAKRIKDML
jgi:hypothetical protein